MKKRNLTFWPMCTAQRKGAVSLWSGELRSMPSVYREAIIDRMFIFAGSSQITKLVFALKDQSLDYGKD